MLARSPRPTFPLAASLVPNDSGTSRVPVNDVTSFLDLSFIHGNSDAISSVLRAGDGTGMLRTAADGDIPFGRVRLTNRVNIGIRTI